MIWRLLKVFNGRRTGAQMWTDWLAERLIDIGFERYAPVPYFFRHMERGLFMDVHMDDFHGVGQNQNAEWLRMVLEGLGLKFKSFSIHGLSAQYEHLKKTYVRCGSGIRIYCNPKYAQQMISLLGLDGCKPAPTPAVVTDQLKEAEEPSLNTEEAGLYRTCVGLALYDTDLKSRIQFAGLLGA